MITTAVVTRSELRTVRENATPSRWHPRRGSPKSPDPTAAHQNHPCTPMAPRRRRPPPCRRSNHGFDLVVGDIHGRHLPVVLDVLALATDAEAQAGRRQGDTLALPAGLFVRPTCEQRHVRPNAQPVPTQRRCLTRGNAAADLQNPNDPRFTRMAEADSPPCFHRPSGPACSPSESTIHARSRHAVPGPGPNSAP